MNDLHDPLEQILNGLILDDRTKMDDLQLEQILRKNEYETST